MKKVINKWQDFIWSKVIVPFADLFKIDCEYCWWWRGVLVGSIITTVLFLLLGKLLELL
nr:MAG TPA: hypothetical protein [Caudoviricetes sp.]